MVTSHCFCKLASEGGRWKLAPRPALFRLSSAYPTSPQSRSANVSSKTRHYCGDQLNLICMNPFFVEHPGTTQERWQSMIALFSSHKGPSNFRRRRPPYKMNASWKARQSIRPADDLAWNFVNTSHSVHYGGWKRREVAVSRWGNWTTRRPPQHDGLPETYAFGPLSHFRISHPVTAKCSAVDALLSRAEAIVTNEEQKQAEFSKIKQELLANDYPARFIDNRLTRIKQRKTEESVRSRDAEAEDQRPQTTVLVPFIDGVTQHLQRILRPLNVRVVGKPRNWKPAAAERSDQSREWPRCCTVVSSQVWRQWTSIHWRNRTHSL